MVQLNSWGANESDASQIAGVQSIIRSQRAYDALRATYGDIAGDPVAATQLSNLDQSKQAFPLEQQQRQLANTGAEQRIDQSTQSFPLDQQRRALANTEAGQEITSTARAQKAQAILGAANVLKSVKDRGGDVLAAYDDIAQKAPNLFDDPQHVGQLRAALASGQVQPEDIVAQYTPTNTGRGGLHVTSVQPDQDGNLIGVMSDGTVRTMGKQSGRFTQGTPGYKGEISKAQAEGKAAGTAAANVPAVENAASNILDRVSQLEQNPNLEAVFGMPSFAAAGKGGFGKFATLPGSPAADAKAQLDALKSMTRSQAFETLKGGGSITEKESEFASQALANMDRAQSYPEFQTELGRFKAIIAKGVATQRAKAAINYGKDTAGTTKTDDGWHIEPVK